MDDWEQPSTSAFGAAAATASAGSDIDALRQDLAAALARIDTLENQVAALQAAVKESRK